MARCGRAGGPPAGGLADPVKSSFPTSMRTYCLKSRDLRSEFASSARSTQ